jgi:hypothetical protein
MKSYPVQPRRLPNQEYLMGWLHALMFVAGTLGLAGFLLWRHL